MKHLVDEVKTQLGDLVTNLLVSLEKGDQAKTLIAQQEFTGTVSTLWNAREEVDFDSKIKAILRLVTGWVINELPVQIQDWKNHAEIKRELKLFQRGLMMFN